MKIVVTHSRVVHKEKRKKEEICAQVRCEKKGKKVVPVAFLIPPAGDW